MKKILFILFCLSLSTLYSQSEKKYDVNSSDLPDWVNLMYANKVDEGKVIQAYELYYELVHIYRSICGINTRAVHLFDKRVQ